MKTIRAIILTLFILISPVLTARAEGDGLQLHLLDVGQGLSVLVQCDGHYLLYDGGGRDFSSFVVSYLQGQGVTQIDYVIASHYDDDHLNGVVGALHAFSVSTILSPDYTADTKVFLSFLEAAQSSGADMIHPARGDSYGLGGASLQIVGPQNYDSAIENNNSIAVRIAYGDTAVLICGDAESEAEEDMVNSGMQLAADVYVVSHHGSASSSSLYFLDHVRPEFALLSCGSDNDYGHPAPETMERLRSLGCTLYRTDRQGTVVLLSDGSTFRSDTAPCTDWSDNSTPAQSEQTAGSAAPSEQALSGATPSEQAAYNISPAQSEQTAGSSGYVCNLNTKKFHYPYCDSVTKMKETNKKYTDESREELISQGFDPCKNCNP